jgi:hypothetical protein
MAYRKAETPIFYAEQRKKYKILIFRRFIRNSSSGISENRRTFASDYEHQDEKKHISMAVVIGISADTATLVASCP